MNSSLSTKIETALGQTNCACAAVRRAARATTQLYDTVLKPSGLKATQFILLNTIAEAGEIPQRRFSNLHAIAVETLSRRLGTLRRAGLLNVKIGENGEHIYSLSEKGKERLNAALPYWKRAQERMLKASGETDLAEVIAMADRLTIAAQEALEMRSRND